VLGTRQTGMLQLRIADLQRDQSLLSAVSQTAEARLGQQPQSVTPLITRWLGNRSRYGAV